MYDYFWLVHNIVNTTQHSAALSIRVMSGGARLGAAGLGPITGKWKEGSLRFPFLEGASSMLLGCGGQGLAGLRSM